MAWTKVNDGVFGGTVGVAPVMEINFFNVSTYNADLLVVIVWANVAQTNPASSITDNAGNSGNFQLVQAVGVNDIFCSMYYCNPLFSTTLPSFYDIQMPMFGSAGTRCNMEVGIWRGAAANPLVTFGANVKTGHPASPINTTFNPVFTDNMTMSIGMISPTATFVNPPMQTIPLLTDPFLFTWNGSNPNAGTAEPGVNINGSGQVKFNANPATFSLNTWTDTVDALFAYMVFKSTDSVKPSPPPGSPNGRVFTRVGGSF